MSTKAQPVALQHRHQLLPDTGLSSQIPHLELQIPVCDCLDVEADCCAERNPHRYGECKRPAWSFQLFHLHVRWDISAEDKFSLSSQSSSSEGEFGREIMVHIFFGESIKN